MRACCRISTRLRTTAGSPNIDALYLSAADVCLFASGQFGPFLGAKS